MKTIIEGATAQVDVSLVKEDGTLEPISTFDVSAAWRAGSSVTPPDPTCTATSTTGWFVLGPTDGLGGRVATLRVTAADPVTGKVYVEDYLYEIKK